MTLLILYALLSILVSFLCSILEAALLSFTHTFIKMKSTEGKSYAETLSHYKQDIDKPLIAILTLNTAAHTVGAILVGAQADKVYDGASNAVGIVSAIMTVLILMVSEIIPKTIGATYWKSLGPFTSRFLKIIIAPLKYSGFLWLMMSLTKLVGKSSENSRMSREEFMAITDEAEEEGVVKENERTFIKNLMKFKSVEAKDIMTPFSVAVTEDEEMTIAAFLKKHKKLKFSRIPVFKSSPNNITGFILKDDVLEEMIDNNGKEPLDSLKRELLITESSTPIPRLFDFFVENQAHIAVVTDEFGNNVGLITMEDIIETLLGLEIMDENDSVEDMQHLARKNWEERAERIGIISKADGEEEEKDGQNENRNQRNGENKS